LNILELPNEVLLKIFSYIHGFKHHYKLSTTCKRFYELSCEFIDCRLKIDSSFVSNRISTPYLDYDDMIDSILNSKRKITLLVLFYEGFSRYYKEDTWICKKEFDSKLKRILERHGSRIEELQVVGQALSTEEVLMLNLMPNLNEIGLRIVNNKKWDVPEDFKLNLPKLREITIYDSTLPVYRLGNHLPDDVLTHAKVYHSGLSVPLSFIAKQRNLKKLILDEFTDLDASQLKLEYLETRSKFDFRGQDKLKRLNFRGPRDASDMNAVATELKSLEHLVMDHPVEDFSPLRVIKSLKKLEVSGVRMGTFLTLQSNFVTELHIEVNIEYIINELTIGQLANGCPNLIKFTLKSFQATILHKQVNRILSLWPRLETLECRFNMQRYKYVEGVEHEHLKYLEMVDDYQNEEVIQLVTNCKRLESLKIKCLTKQNFLKNLLVNRPTLKILCAYSMSKKNDFAQVLVSFGKNLTCFHSFDAIQDKIMKRYLADDELNKQFPYIVNHRRGFWLKKDESIECRCYDLEFERVTFI
jgi:hypothetical protein